MSGEQRKSGKVIQPKRNALSQEKRSSAKTPAKHQPTGHRHAFQRNAPSAEPLAQSPLPEPREASLTAAQKEAVRKLAMEIVSGGIEKLKKEFLLLKETRAVDTKKTTFLANPRKCRYKDVACWDATRVKFTFPIPDDSFIHANYVRHESLANTFICCQGPMESTVIDFWRMCWQEKVCLIIMLCQCMELNKSKCAQYWPKCVSESKVTGPFTITCTDVNSDDVNVTVTRMTLQHGSDLREVLHRHWVTWPDKTVPKSSAVAFKLLQFPRELPNNPTVVHCSAGVGRTGTLVLLEMIVRTLLGGGRKSREIRVAELLKELRVQRAQSVQTEDQYVYVNFSMVQYAVMRKALTKEDIKGFLVSYDAYLKAVEQAQKHKKPKKPKQPSAVEKLTDDRITDCDNEKPSAELVDCIDDPAAPDGMPVETKVPEAKHEIPPANNSIIAQPTVMCASPTIAAPPPPLPQFAPLPVLPAMPGAIGVLPPQQCPSPPPPLPPPPPPPQLQLQPQPQPQMQPQLQPQIQQQPHPLMQAQPPMNPSFPAPLQQQNAPAMFKPKPNISGYEKAAPQPVGAPNAPPSPPIAMSSVPPDVLAQLQRQNIGLPPQNANPAQPPLANPGARMPMSPPPARPPPVFTPPPPPPPP